MGSQFLKSFAFGMNDEIQTLGQLALQGALQFPTGGETPQQQPAMAAPPMAVPPVQPAPAVSQAIPVIDYIKANTTGEASSYDTLFGNAEQPGGPFEGVKLTDMTIGEVKEFTRPDGPYAAYVRKQVGRTATPTGRFQIVGDTLTDVSGDLSDDTPYSPETQDMLAERIFDKQGPAAWEAWGGKGGGGGVTMSSRGAPTGGGTEPSVDVSDLEENAPDMSKKAQRRRKWGSVLEGLGAGFGQMSHGQTVDLSNVIEAYHDRQEEMRDRLMEISQEKRRQVERVEDVGLGIESDYRRGDIAEGAAVRSDQRRETAAIQQEQRDEAKAERERKRIAEVVKGTLPLMFPDVDATTAGSIAEIDGPLAAKWAETRQTEADAIKEETRLKAENQPIADYMAAAGQPEIGILALTDPDKAFTQFEKVTGNTDAMKEALVLMDPTTRQAQALALRLKLEAGTGDERIAAAAVSQDKLITEAETRVNDYRIFDRQLQMATDLASSTDQGFTEKLMMVPDKILADFGIDRDSATQKTVFDAVMKRSTAGVLAAENKGAASDRDTAFFEQSLPSLGNTEEANKTIAYVNRELMRREQVYVDAWREHNVSSDAWLDSEDRYAYIQRKMEAAGATGDVIPRVETVEAAVSLPAGTPFIIVGDDGSQVLAIAE